MEKNDALSTVGMDKLPAPVYISCHSDLDDFARFASWANLNNEKITTWPADAASIVCVGNAETDLAVLACITAMERYTEQWPAAQVYCGGALACSPFIELGAFKRVRSPLCTEFIHDRTLVNWAPPFWVHNFNESQSRLGAGHLFRKHYPLITYRHGEKIETPPAKSVEEFELFEDTVLLTRRPTPKYLYKWFDIAKANAKPISLRNIDPHTALLVWHRLENLAAADLLDVFHCRLQPMNPEDWDPDAAQSVTERVADGQLKDTYTAATALTELAGVPSAGMHWPSAKFFEHNAQEIAEAFEYVTFKPYWDRVWRRSDAEARWRKFFHKDP
jgi:hypothetical protein